MDPLTGYLILFAIGWILRSGVQHARDDYRRTREQQVKAAEKGNPPLAPSARNKLRRRHRMGWWASEVGRGFPLTRTGVHTGWLAHQAAAMQTRALREEARTTHLDATVSFAAAVKAHRERQAAIRAEIEEALATSPVRQDGSRRAVREAAGAVILPFPARKEAAPEPGPYVPAVVCRVCTRPGSDADPLVPAGIGFSHRSHMERGEAIVRAVRDIQPEHGPHAARDDARPDDSDHLRPGEARCEGCGGTGRNDDGTDACPACRGWGSAAPDPATLSPAPEGGICAACGRPGTAGDPVLADPSGHAIHRSHLAGRHERYQQAMSALPACAECGDPLRLRPHDGWAHLDCDRVSGAEADAAEVRDDRDLEIAEAELRGQGRCPYQTGTDGGGTYCGRGITDTGGDEPDEWCPEHARAVQGDDAGAVRERNDRVSELLYRARHSTATEGAPPMSGDTTFSGVKRASTAAIGHADQDAATIRGRKDAAFALADEMVALDVDPVVVSEQMAYAEALRDAEAALARAGEHATATSSQLERYHGGMQEATDSAPGAVADRNFHQGS